MCILLSRLYIGSDYEKGGLAKEGKQRVFKVVLTSIHNLHVWAKLNCISFFNILSGTQQFQELHVYLEKPV